MRFHGCKHLASACFGRMVYFYVPWLQELGADVGFVWFCGCQAQLQGIAISLGFCFGAVGFSMAAFGLRGCRRDMTWLFGKDGFRPIYRCLWSVHDESGFLRPQHTWTTLYQTNTSEISEALQGGYPWAQVASATPNCLTTQCPLTSPQHPCTGGFFAAEIEAYTRFQDITWSLIPEDAEWANVMGFNVMCRRGFCLASDTSDIRDLLGCQAKSVAILRKPVSWEVKQKAADFWGETDD